MPYINIKITKERATPEQKARLIQEVTRLPSEILGKNPQTTVVVIDEVETDNWGIGGETVTIRRHREQKGGINHEAEYILSSSPTNPFVNTKPRHTVFVVALIWSVRAD